MALPSLGIRKVHSYRSMIIVSGLGDIEARPQARMSN